MLSSRLRIDYARGIAAAAFARKKSVKSSGGRNMAMCYSSSIYSHPSGIEDDRVGASSALRPRGPLGPATMFSK
jgi:hypothetical protein